MSGYSSRSSLSNVDLRLLRMFRVVVQHGGFSAAQVHLGVSAAKISMDIRALEQRLGYQLCRRGKAGFELTDEGRSVYAASDRLMAAIEAFTSETDQAAGKVSGVLRIGLLDALSTDPAAPVSQAIGRFNARQHDVHLVLKVDTPQELQFQILDERLHVGILSTLRKLPQLQYEPSHTERHYLYCGRRHPFFRLADADISLEMIHGARIVARSYWQYQELDNIQASNPAATVEQMESELILILSGAYVGFLPMHLARTWVKAGRIRPIKPDQLFYDAPFYIVTKKAGSPNRALTAFMEDLKSTFGRHRSAASADVSIVREIQSDGGLT